MRHGLTVICLMFGWILQGVAQDSAPKPPTPDKGRERVTGRATPFSAQTRVVTLPVRVQDKKGNSVVGLGRGAFRLLEDGVERPILFLEPDRTPVSVAILVEFSRATEFVHQDVRDAVATLASILRPDDYCALVGFGNNPRILMDFSRDRDELLHETARVRFTAQTGVELKAGLQFVLDRMKGVEGKKAVVLLATGLDSSPGGVEGLATRLGQEGLAVYCVAVGRNTLLAMDSWLSEGDHYRLFQAEHTLRRLAEASGGASFFPAAPTAFPGAFRQVARLMQTQYMLAFEPSPDARPGKKHKLSLEVQYDLDRDGKAEALPVFAPKEYCLPER